MSDKKMKPPRPPAPAAKGKKISKKSLQNGPSISFHYHKDADIEDEEDTGVSMLTNSKSSKRESDVEHKAASPKNELSTKEAIDDPLGASRKTEWNDNRLDSDVFAESSTSRTKTSSKRDADKKQRTKETKKIDTGIIKITNEVITVDDDNNFSIPSESKEAISDPLTFVDKLQDDQRKREAARLEEMKKEERRARLEAALWAKEGVKDPDDLNVDPFYYNVPTPSEVPDEPRRPQPEGAIALSLSGLLEKSQTDESVRPKELTKVPASRTKDSTPPKTPSEDSFSELEKEILSDVESPSGKPYSKEEYDATFNMEGNQILIPKYRLTLMSLVIFCYWIFPLPAYLVGLMTGMIASFYCLLFAIWVSLPETVRESPETPDSQIPLVIPGDRLSAPKARAKEQEKIFHQGWMNELPHEYDADTYHIQQTHSVYLRLDGTVLRLLQPKVNVPKRAMWDESLQKPIFERQRHYDLRGSTVHLLPDGLVSKRTWSKKYPICIEFEKKDTDLLKDMKIAEDEKIEQESMKDLQGYDFIKRDEFNNNVVYLFARTGREKEEWFWKFETAAKYKKIRGKKPIQTLNRSVYLRGNEYTKEDGTKHLYRLDPEDLSSRKGAMDFYKYISKILPKEKENTLAQSVNVKSGGVTYGSSTRPNATTGIKVSPDGGLAESPVSWVNALLGRFFWDFLREEHSKDWVKHKLQKKLSKIRVPSFIDELTITDIDLGLNSPLLRRMSRPHIDERGVWVDLDIAYSGSCCMTLETKVNLWRLKKGASLERELEEISPGMRKMSEKRERHSVKKNTSYNNEDDDRQNTAALNSDEEDSAESSDDDEDESQPVADSATSQDADSGIKNSSKILRIVNKIASSKYFQNATQYKYVKKAFDEVSSTPILLRVEVKSLNGTLALNIPPPPTNRLWYGFRGKPNLWLSAKPKLGERQVTITHITDFIEKKLELEFQKIFVLPNMDDLVIPIMQGEIESNRF